LPFFLAESKKYFLTTALYMQFSPRARLPGWRA
jgi:hypothetical protein